MPWDGRIRESGKRNGYRSLEQQLFNMVNCRQIEIFQLLRVWTMDSNGIRVSLCTLNCTATELTMGFRNPDDHWPYGVFPFDTDKSSTKARRKCGQCFVERDIVFVKKDHLPVAIFPHFTERLQFIPMLIQKLDSVWKKRFIPTLNSPPRWLDWIRRSFHNLAERGLIEFSIPIPDLLVFLWCRIIPVNLENY